MSGVEGGRRQKVRRWEVEKLGRYGRKGTLVKS
jgi:hypothetical protein